MRIVAFWIAVALLAPLIAPVSAEAIDMLPWPIPPLRRNIGSAPIFLGRDILSRIIWGARTVLTVSPVAVRRRHLRRPDCSGCSPAIAAAGSMRRDHRICDILLVFPVIILYMIIIARFGAVGVEYHPRDLR